MFAALALDIGKPYLHKQLCFREESRTESHISKLIKSSRVQIFNIKRLKKDSCQNKKISEIAILSWCENLRSWRLHEFMNSFIHSFIHSMLMSFLLANKTTPKKPRILMESWRQSWNTPSFQCCLQKHWHLLEICFAKNFWRCKHLT